jgi:hypothetical protein
LTERELSAGWCTEIVDRERTVGESVVRSTGRELLAGTGRDKGRLPRRVGGCRKRQGSSPPAGRWVQKSCGRRCVGAEPRCIAVRGGGSGWSCGAQASCRRRWVGVEPWSTAVGLSARRCTGRGYGGVPRGGRSQRGGCRVVSGSRRGGCITLHDRRTLSTSMPAIVRSCVSALMVEMPVGTPRPAMMRCTIEGRRRPPAGH